MTKDFADFLDALNNEGAAYVVIGAMAVTFHIPYRTTRDIDVLIGPTVENARRVPGTFKGVSTSFASLDDLIAMKEASGRREKDLPDLKSLRRLKEKLGH
jgi:predicted nucleotidyltransferase